MVILLSLVIVSLLLTVWMASRLVQGAHRRASEDALRAAAFYAEEKSVDVNPYAAEALVDSPPITFQEDTPAIPIPSASSGAGDVYADPIDGVPFAPGEFTIPCHCGVAYRAESLDWLAGHFGGRCVQCGSHVEAALGCIP